MFVDTRLHIAVRPPLEYKLPHAGRSIASTLLGDRPIQEALDALEECLLPSPAEPAAMERHGDFQCLCARVCTHTNEYLQWMADTWLQHIREYASNISHKTCELTNEYEEAGRVRRRYLARDPSMVEREYRQEVKRIQSALQNELHHARTTPHPQCERPDTLVKATNDLKEAFAQAYGTVPTETLQNIKVHFERELLELQRPIADHFVKRATAVLRK